MYSRVAKSNTVGIKTSGIKITMKKLLLFMKKTTLLTAIGSLYFIQEVYIK